ncbi:MAG: cysteine-rich small domain-containing protein [Paludibacteraceae bacterium]|nr:cysteine-rich small domain-containing protein [Paludibacteraceae bacterium]HQF50540.1 cysteine-rich small domain-containing protein [Paludibacteraceae bacterium]
MAYDFYCNKECDFFPCHKTNKPEEFNCMFCYCPLYMLGEDCGGIFKYLSNGIKDCSDCLLPHTKEKGYEFIQEKMNVVINKVKKGDGEIELSPKHSCCCTDKDKEE